MKKIIIIILIFISFTSAYDKYLTDKKVYLCKKMETVNTYGFGTYILDLFVDSLDEYINFVDHNGINEKELVTYSQNYAWAERKSNKLPKFPVDFPADYFIVLKVRIDSAYAPNKPTTFNIVNATFPKIKYGSFTIGDDKKMYNQYYVSIEASIYSVETGILYYYMYNENDSHEEEDVFEKEITYNINECLEDFPDKFNDSSMWRYYKKVNKDLLSK